jgi:protein involved in polysaccharide export with SLBB domain/tetratricopeptide (TPR) repeat protein
MKQGLLIGIFSLLALTPFDYALGQAGSNSQPVKAVETSSAGGGSTTDDQKSQDPASEASPGNATAKNLTTPPTLTDSTEAVSKVNIKTSSEAEKNYKAGVTFYEAAKFNKAISAFNESNRLKPNDPQTQYMLGMVYWKTAAYEDALESFKLAVRLKPDWADAYFRLGQTYYVLGEKKETNEAYKKLLELNSPLANKLYGTNNYANPTNLAGGPKAEPADAIAKQPVVVPVSTPAVAGPLKEKARATANESNSSSTPAASSNKAIRTVARPNERSPTVSESNSSSTPAASSNKAILTVARPNEGPSPAVSELNNTPTTARTATGDPASGNKAIASDDSTLTDIYKVGVGDVLDIRLLNSAGNGSTLYTVIEGGWIDFPLAGKPIPVAGLTTKDIQTRITSELKRLSMEERARVVVGVRQYASHTVLITGLVSNPGTKILRREAVPLYVLLAEVQPGPEAARAAIIRAGTSNQVVDLSDSAALNFIVRTGDVINLTTRPQDFYYIAGRMSSPGQKIFQPGITLFQAILAAGGLARDNVVELSREGSDGRLATTKFNLKEIKSGKIQDPKIQPGDRIEVLR